MVSTSVVQGGRRSSKDGTNFDGTELITPCRLCRVREAFEDRSEAARDAKFAEVGLVRAAGGKFELEQSILRGKLLLLLVDNAPERSRGGFT